MAVRLKACGTVTMQLDVGQASQPNNQECRVNKNNNNSSTLPFHKLLKTQRYQEFMDLKLGMLSGFSGTGSSVSEYVSACTRRKTDECQVTALFRVLCDGKIRIIL